MKAALLLLAFLGQMAPQPPAVPLREASPDFPLRVHLFSASWGLDYQEMMRRNPMRGNGPMRPTGSYHGMGKGNLLGESPRGFDYVFDCDPAFVENRQPDEVYQARWTKPNMKLEILTQPIGDDRGKVCALSVTLREEPYTAASVRERSGQLPRSNFWQAPDIAYTQDDPDYPVKFRVTHAMAQNYAAGTQGYGSANLFGEPVRGFDFVYNCGHGFFEDAQPKSFFQGHWVKQDQELEVLLQRIGSDTVDRCILKITYAAQPYADPVAAAPPPPLATRPELSRP